MQVSSSITSAYFERGNVEIEVRLTLGVGHRSSGPRSGGTTS
jgi:hypothetical protein